MWAVLAPTAEFHSWTALAMNSGPLSERMWPGTPRRMNKSESTSMTSMALSLRATRIARHSWVNPSMTHAEPPSIVRPVLYEVVGPNVITMLGPQPNARSVRQPEPSSFGLLPGHLQPLASPNPLDPIVIDETT